MKKMITTAALALGVLFSAPSEAQAHHPTHHSTGVITVNSFHWVWVSGYWVGHHYHTGYWKQVRTTVAHPHRVVRHPVRRHSHRRSTHARRHSHR